jgi:hypothetical protein
MQLKLIFIVVLLLAGCASSPSKTLPNPKVFPDPKNFSDINGYLTGLNNYYVTDTRKDGSLDVYRFTGAAYANHLKRISSGLFDLCRFKYNGISYKYTDPRGKYITADYAVKKLKLKFVEHQAMSMIGKVVDVSPWKTGSGRLPAMSIQAAHAFNQDAVSFQREDDTGVCATQDQKTGLFSYHFSYSLFGTVNETNSSYPEPPLYLLIDSSDYLKTLEGEALKEYAKKARLNSQKLKQTASSYQSKNLNGAFYELKIIDKKNRGVLLRIELKNQDKSPLHFNAKDTFQIQTKEGLLFDLALNLEGQTAVLDGCVFISKDDWTVLINPGTKCRIDIPAIALGLPFEVEVLELKYGNNSHELDPISEYANLSKKYSQ